VKRLITAVSILLSACMICCVQPATAQARDGDSQPGLLAQRRVQGWNALVKRLDLTEEQKVKIRNILDNARQEAQKLRDNSSLTPQEKRARLRELRRNARQEIGSVLTPEQRTKLQKLRVGLWHRWHVQRAYRAGKAAKALGLNKAQEQAIAEILRHAREERHRIWSDGMLTPQEKVQTLMNLRRNVWDKVHQQLTPQQQDKLRVGIARRWHMWNRIRQPR